MVGITSSGVGSGLDIRGLVNQLVSAERAPTAQRLQRLESQTRVEISAYGQLRSALAGLQSVLTGSAASSSVDARSVSLSSESAVTASAADGAALGTFDLIVERLAKSGRSVSQTPRDPALGLGTGTLNLNLDSDSFAVTLTDPATTLAQLRDLINAAPDNPGLRASIIQVDGGSVLSLGSDRLGLESAISLGGTGDMATFAADVGVTRPGEDALVRIDGMLRTVSSNVLDDAIEGVSLTLLQADPSATVSMTVSRNDSALEEAVQSLVTAWNSFASRADTLSEYNPVTGNGGPLNGNALLRGIESSLRALVSAGQGSSGDLLGGEFGLSFDAQGKLALDTAQLTTALSERRADVEAWWSGSDGLVSRLGNSVDTLLGQDASLRSREVALEAELQRIAAREEKLDLRMERVESRYLKQFTALDIVLAQLQNTSNFLSSQLGSLPTQ